MIKRYTKPKAVRVSKNKAVAILEKRASELWKEYAFLRDGRVCKVAEKYPGMRKHSGVLQVDHCFSRAIKSIFYEPSNSTVICSGCNAAKGFGSEQVEIAVRKIVEAREGKEKFYEMEDKALSHKPHDGWKKVWWLESVVEMLESKIREIKR